MVLTDYDVIFDLVRGLKELPRVVIAGAESDNVIAGGFECLRERLSFPVFVGDQDKIKRLIAEGGFEDEPCEIVPCLEGEDPCVKAVELVAEGAGDCLMKGLVETADFLRPIVSRKYGLRTGGAITHVGFAKLPNYPKLVALSDCAIIPFPDVDARQHMVENMTGVFHALGVERPNIGLLSAVEVENPSIPDTSEALELVRRWRGGAMAGCNLAGPISYDLAMSRRSAELKGYDCPWCGDFDGLVASNIVVANVLGKSWQITAETPQGGLVVGAKVPVLVNSRSMEAGDRIRSMAVAMAVAAGQKS